MEIKFDVDISVKDMYKFLVNNTYRRLTGIIWIIFSLVVVAVTVYTWGDVDIMYSVLMILLASLYTVINPVMLYFKARKQVANNESFNSTLHYVVDDKGIKISQNNEKASVKWDEIWKVVRYGNEVIVYVTTVRAFVWPVDSIGDSYDRLAQLACDKLDRRCSLRKKN